MAGNFHRLTTPTYYTGGGTFPPDAGVTYDYINNGGAGTPSAADSAKVGGPNANTYFVAFGEDATSSNANRPAKAISQNTDHLDDLMHRPIAIPVRTSTATAGAGGVSTIVLPINTYLGPSGTTNTATGLSAIFSVLDDNDREILNANVEVKVNTVTLTGLDTVGSDDFSANTVQLNISPAIPDGTSYRVYYSSRSNLASLSTDCFSFIKVRGAQEIDADVERVLSNLHGNNLVWDAAWTSTIFDLTNRGMQGVYDRDTVADFTPPSEVAGTSPFNLNPSTQSGLGGWFERIGPAITGYAQLATAYADPVNAVFASKFGSPTVYSSGGSVGFVAYGNRRYAYWDGSSSFDTEESAAPEYATFLSLHSHTQNPLSLTTNGANGIRTRIPLGTTCILSNLGDSDTGSATVTLTGASSWFMDSVGKTAIMPGYDLLELEYTQSGTLKRESFVITVINSTTSANVRRPDGKVPSFTGASAVTVVGWHSVGLALGDGAGLRHSRRYTYTGASKLDGLFYAAPPVIYNPAGSGGEQEVPAKFFSNSSSGAAIRWGYFERDTTLGAEGTSWGLLEKGAFLGSGEIVAPKGSIALVEAQRTQVAATAVDSRTVDTADGLGGGAVTITLDLGSYSHFEITLTNSDGVNFLAGVSDIVFVNTPASTNPAMSLMSKGATFTLVLRANSTQTGGAGKVNATALFPTAVVKNAGASDNFFYLRANQTITYKFVTTSFAIATGVPTMQLVSTTYGTGGL